MKFDSLLCCAALLLRCCLHAALAVRTTDAQPRLPPVALLAVAAAAVAVPLRPPPAAFSPTHRSAHTAPSPSSLSRPHPSGAMSAPVMVLNANAKRETGRKAQTSNIQAAKAVADVIRTTLGPRSMLKMILDPMGGIVMTNDGSVTTNNERGSDSGGGQRRRALGLAGVVSPVAQPWRFERQSMNSCSVAFLRCAWTVMQRCWIQRCGSNRQQRIDRSHVQTQLRAHRRSLSPVIRLRLFVAVVVPILFRRMCTYCSVLLVLVSPIALRASFALPSPPRCPHSETRFCVRSMLRTRPRRA